MALEPADISERLARTDLHKIPGLSLRQMRRERRWLAKARQTLEPSYALYPIIGTRIQNLDHEIERRVQDWTLRWAVVAAVGTLVLIAFDTPLSRIVNPLSK